MQADATDATATTVSQDEIPIAEQEYNVQEIATVTRALTETSPSFGPLLKSNKLLELLHKVNNPQSWDQPRGGGGGGAFKSAATDVDSTTSTDYYNLADLKWIFTAKATLQTFGIVLNTLLEETISLDDDIWFWDEVVGSYFNTALYTIQTSPLRLLEPISRVYARLKEQRSNESLLKHQVSSITSRWRTFYDVVYESVKHRTLGRAKSSVLRPFTLCRSEALRRREGLKNMRVMNASAIGLLVGEGFTFEFDDENESSVHGLSVKREYWHNIVCRTSLLMQTILRNLNVRDDTELAEFQDNVWADIDGDIESLQQPQGVSTQLVHILEVALPKHRESFQGMAKQYSRPPRIVRYWIPALAVLSSSATILRFLTGRRAEIITWVSELGSTVVDFWRNWVIDPLKKVIGTIRHDEKSEVALMSKASLQADRESLERMVVDFAMDQKAHGANSDNKAPPSSSSPSSSSWSQEDISIIQSKVKEGDLTPVLRAYERDLRQPFVGTVRGDLVRALLIQIQKTKVDVEVAIGGIDALLKSQELVFG